jgi:hypothetical protein
MKSPAGSVASETYDFARLLDRLVTECTLCHCEIRLWDLGRANTHLILCRNCLAPPSLLSISQVPHLKAVA